MSDEISETITATLNMRRLKIGERRRKGDWYLCKWRNELIRLVDDPTFFSRKLTVLHLPHYRISSSIINLETDYE